jgi:hypothetical protein
LVLLAARLPNFRFAVPGCRPRSRRSTARKGGALKRRDRSTHASPRHRLPVLLWAAASVVLLGALSIPASAQAFSATSLSLPDSSGPLSLCGNAASPPGPIQHVVVVMLENLSYNQVVGSANAPYETSLASRCGVAPDYFAATHTSAANYMAVAGGQFPTSSPAGCGSARACATPQDNLYNQLTSAGQTWGGYQESMPTACAPAGSGANTPSHTLYSVGHNPPVFYTDISHASCQASDVGVADLSAPAGAFYSALQNQSLPSFSWITPSAANDAEGPGTAAQNEQVADAWLQRFMTTVSQSSSYQAGNTVVLITYDEGSGRDKQTGENCTNESLDLPVVNTVSAHQESCHVPLFVAYPYTPAGDDDTAFFDHYSITKAVEDLFGLPYLAHAGDAQTNSLIGHFGLAIGSPIVTTPAVTITAPAGTTTVSGALTVSGTAGDSAGIASVQVGVDDGVAQPATGTTDWTTSLDTTALTNGTHTINVEATDTAGHVGTASVTVTVNNSTTPVVTISQPADGSSVVGSLTVSGTAGDAAGISSVQLDVDGGTAQPVTGTTDWTTTVDTTMLTSGPHTIDVEATDAAGTVGSASVTVAVAADNTTTPAVTISQPSAASTVSGVLTVAGTADDGRGIASVQVGVDTQPPHQAAGTSNWSTSLDTTGLTNGPHVINVQATDTSGTVGSASVTVTVNNASAATACPALPAGATELSGNTSLEAGQTGWTVPYNAASVVARVAPAGGSDDGSWALQVAIKPGKSGIAGVKNDSPVWVPGAPGLAAVAGKLYTGSAVVRASAPGETLSLLLRETTANGAGVRTHTAVVTLPDTAWHQITSSVTAQTTGNVIRYALYASNLGTSRQSFLADCLGLQTQ